MSDNTLTPLQRQLYPYARHLLDDLFGRDTRTMKVIEVGLRPRLPHRDRLSEIEDVLLREGWLENPLKDGRVRISLEGCRVMGLVLPDPA